MNKNNTTCNNITVNKIKMKKMQIQEDALEIGNEKQKNSTNLMVQTTLIVEYKYG